MNSIVKNKEKLQNTKKTKGILKRFSILTLSFVFLLMSFNFSFANGNLPTYSSVPDYATISLSNVYTVSGNIKTYYGCNNSNCDYFYYYNTAYSRYYPMIVNTSSFNVYTAVSVNNNSASISTYSSERSGALHYAHPYYNSTDYGETTFPYLGEFNNDSSALTYYTNNGVQYPVIEEPIKFPFTLQNGYLFVYDCGQSNTTYSFDLSSKSEEYSDIGSIPFPDTNQSYWFSNSLPEIDETTIPDSSATIISWQKGDKTNIFGQTQDMIATISGTSSGRYLYIYNPPVHYKWSGSSNPIASETINYPMIINGVSENENWYIYDSVARLTDFNQGGKVSGTITGEQVIGSVSSEGGITLITSNGAIYTQNSGGSTDISGANGGSLAENINGLKETLDNFVNQFIQLLSAPISHIQQLIQSSNQFFDVFSQLFDWLPSELSSVIVSGLIIMVVIGVIKMLL